MNIGVCVRRLDMFCRMNTFNVTFSYHIRRCKKNYLQTWKLDDCKFCWRHPCMKVLPLQVEARGKAEDAAAFRSASVPNWRPDIKGFYCHRQESPTKSCIKSVRSVCYSGVRWREWMCKIKRRECTTSVKNV